MGGPADPVCHIGVRLPLGQVTMRKYVNDCDRLKPNVGCSNLTDPAGEPIAVSTGLSWIPAQNAQVNFPSFHTTWASARKAGHTVSATSATAAGGTEKASMQDGATPKRSATPAFIAGWEAWSGQPPRPRVESFA